MGDSQPKRFAQQHRSLKVTRNATNEDKHVNEASKQIFASNLFTISRKYTHSMLSDRKICFNALNIQNYDDFLCDLSKFIERVVRLAYANFGIRLQ